MAKIFEKCLKKRLNDFFNKHDIISDHQYGFREGRSTNNAISEIIGKIYKFVDSGRPALCVFLDLAKAFDTVDHSQLLEELARAGIRGVTLELFSSYLKDRKQVVKIKDKISHENTISHGIPQGTVLGPILFNLYINSLLSMQTAGEIISFADDTAVLYSSDSWQNLQNVVENDFKNIADWFKFKLLTINFDKTYFLPFSSYKNGLPEFDRLMISNQIEINITDKMKYLGVIIDSHLRWDHQVSSICKIIRCLLPKFKFLRTIINPSHLRTIYYSLVQSRLQYGILSWGGVAYSHLKQLDVLQKKVLKIMTFKKFTYPSDELFVETRIMDVRQMYMYNIILYLYNNRKILERINHNYPTRNRLKENLKIPSANKTIGQKYYLYLSSRVLNALPDIYKIYLQTINSVNLLKRIFKTYVLHIPRADVRYLILDVYMS